MALEARRVRPGHLQCGGRRRERVLAADLLAIILTVRRSRVQLNLIFHISACDGRLGSFSSEGFSVGPPQREATPLARQ